MVRTPTGPRVKDEGFVPDGLDGAGGGEAILRPVGPRRRPNGRLYLPRMIGPVEDLAFLRWCRSQVQHVLLYGPAGTGKNAVIEAAFAPDPAQEDAAGPPAFTQLTMGLNTTEADLLGTFTQDPESGRYVWVDGPLTTAVRLDVPFIADEVFLADSRVLSATLYPLMDERGFLAIPANPALDPIPVGPEFVVFGTGNPNAPDAVFSEALRSRFHHHVEVTADWPLAQELGVPADIIPVCRELDERRDKGELTVSPQLRELLPYRDMARVFGTAMARQGLVGRMPVDARPALIEALHSVFGVRYGPLRSGSRATSSASARRH